MATQEYFGGDADKATTERKSRAHTKSHARSVGRAYPMPPTSWKGARPGPGVGDTHHLTPVRQSTVDGKYYFRATAETMEPERATERVDGVDVTIERTAVLMDPRKMLAPSIDEEPVKVVRR